VLDVEGVHGELVGPRAPVAGLAALHVLLELGLNFLTREHGHTVGQRRRV
jgi:hypothetical protein